MDESRLILKYRQSVKNRFPLEEDTSCTMAKSRNPETTRAQDGERSPGSEPARQEAAAGASRSRTGAIDRALQIFDGLQHANRPMTAYEIAQTVGAPPSTVYAIINDLVDKNLLTRAAGGAIWLGPRLYGYGLTYASSLDYLAVAAEEMERLSQVVGETVQVCGREEGMMVVLQMVEGPGHFRVTSRVGSRMPVNWTASGRLLVGHLPDGERETFFARHSKPSPTGLASTDPATLAQRSRDAFEARFALQIGESDASVACLAAPVCNASGECVITISIVMTQSKTAEGIDRYRASVQSAARRIEERLGWQRTARETATPIFS